MNPKKSIFSYFICFLYTIFCATALVLCLLSSPFLKSSGSNVEKGLLICGFFLVLISVYGIFRVIALKIYDKMKNPLGLIRILSLILPVLVLLAVVARLALYMMGHIPIILPESSFYEAAYIKADQLSLPFLAQGASYIYLQILHGLFFLFGNNPFVGIVFQIVLFFIGLMAIYFAIYHLSGPIAGAISMGLFGLMPATLRFVFTLTPELLFFVFYAIGLYLISLVYRAVKEKKYESTWHYIVLIPIGIYLAFLIYLDLFSITLFLFFLGLFGLDEVVKNKKQVLLISMFTWIGVLDGMILILSILVFSGTTTLETYFYGLLKGYSFREQISFFITTSDINIYASVVVISLAFWCSMSYFFLKKNYSGAYMLTMLVMASMMVCFTPYMDMQMMNSSLWYILVAMGISGIFRMENAVVYKEKVKPVLDEKEESSDHDELVMFMEPKPVEKPLPGQPLHNPLPVPKKHEKRSIDFKKEVDDKDLHFDFDVNVEDDFDH